MEERVSFGGIERLYGKNGYDILKNSHVMVIGLGGVGSFAVEALARSGIGRITLVDLDDICVTNINRQLCALNSTIGQMKGQVLKERIKDINPNCQVEFKEEFFSESTADLLLATKIDFVIDAIDGLKSKCLLISQCLQKNIPIVTVGGAAGKKSPQEIKIIDLGLTKNDALLQRVRKTLRREYGLKKAVEDSSFANPKKLNIMAIYSPEAPMYPGANGEVCPHPMNGTQDHLDCEEGMGSVTHITGQFGLMAASVVINTLTKNRLY